MKFSSRILTSKSSWQKVLLFGSIIIVVLAIILCIVIAHVSSKQPQDMIDITNYPETASIPEETKQNLQRHLYTILSEHFNIPSDASIKIVIRPDTYKTTNKNGINYATFIADLDAYQQSYSVQLSYSDEHEITDDVSISCAPLDVTKYPEQVCFGAYDSSNSPSFYLPYEGELASGFAFEATYGYQDDYGYNHITVTVQCSNDSRIKDEAVSATKSYLESINLLNANNYIYERASNFKGC